MLARTHMHETLGQKVETETLKYERMKMISIHFIENLKENEKNNFELIILIIT